MRAGQYWRFRLRANPVHSVRTGIVPSCRGKVYAHVTVQQQKQWLQKKAACCGFGFANSDAEDRSFDVVESETLRFNRQNKYVTSGVATFEGVLRVTDSEVFTRALTNGIGRAKAFGCGSVYNSKAVMNAPGAEKPELQELPQIKNVFRSST